MAVKNYNGNDRAFLAACEKAKVQATHRQYRKYCRGFGSAHEANKK